MSIRSTPYPLSSKVKNTESPVETHMTQQEYYEKMIPDRIKNVGFCPAQSNDLMSINYLDDRKLCSLEPSAFGSLILVYTIKESLIHAGILFTSGTIFSCVESFNVYINKSVLLK